MQQGTPKLPELGRREQAHLHHPWFTVPLRVALPEESTLSTGSSSLLGAPALARLEAESKAQHSQPRNTSQLWDIHACSDFCFTHLSKQANACSILTA